MTSNKCSINNLKWDKHEPNWSIDVINRILIGKLHRLMSTLTRAIIVEVDFQMMTEKVTSPMKIKIKFMPNFHIMLDDVVSRDLELSTKEHNQRIFIILNHNKKILKVKLMKLEDLPCLLPNLVYILINKETIMILI